MSTMTQTFEVSGMHCGSCALLIDEALQDLPGVLSASTSRRAGQTIAQIDTGRASPEAVIAAITALGYQAVIDRAH